MLIIVFFAFGSCAVYASESMRLGNYTSQPIGHFEFCKINPKKCQHIKQSPPLHLSTELWELLDGINTLYNDGISPVPDINLYGREEVWAYTMTEGDCDDYVLTKQKELEERGIPASVLLITVVKKRDGEGHAVLVVRTDRGDLVLDNLDPKIKFWNETDYRYIKRQSSWDSNKWVLIESQPNSLTASVQ
jgi:predicted transglutaminase-like cysteine proteinase